MHAGGVQTVSLGGVQRSNKERQLGLVGFLKWA